MPSACATCSVARSITTMTEPREQTAPDSVASVSAANVTAADAERRLHPMSWLFVLLQQIKQFVVPLIAAFFFGGDRNELWPMIGVGVLALVSVWRYFTYRYGVVGDALVVRSGLLERSLRVIPFARIHNVALQQSVLHRVFGVAEVRLESAGGQKPEAEMRVLKLSDALALEALVRRRGAQAVETVADVTDTAADAVAGRGRARGTGVEPGPDRCRRRDRWSLAIQPAPGSESVRALGRMAARLGGAQRPGTGAVRDRRTQPVRGGGAAAAPVFGAAGAAAVLRFHPERTRPSPHRRTRPAGALAHQRLAATRPGLDAARGPDASPAQAPQPRNRHRGRRTAKPAARPARTRPGRQAGHLRCTDPTPAAARAVATAAMAVAGGERVVAAVRQ